MLHHPKMLSELTAFSCVNYLLTWSNHVNEEEKLFIESNFTKFPEISLLYLEVDLVVRLL